ncbi:DUF3169 family protein [Paenibacillus agricola]|uniref:DUF3169 family protein n=1 Tax=Paenibacillus agricola TaxID=2716264 RepID=A0ABX0JEI3_9BACL|nr:DUF3169 family protein [Paenibacillus agricola]NHN33646.1 DUF3169 family protein [Paenibacillus agricola]
MKNKTKNMLYLVFMMVIGGACGFLISSGLIPRPANLSFNPGIFYDYDVIFGVIATACIILTLWNVIGLLRFSSIQESKPISTEEEGPTQKELTVGTLIKISAYNLIAAFLWTALCFAYLASKEARATDNETFLLINLVSASVFALIATALQLINIRHYNKLYPDRSINLGSRNAQRELFDKLDEAERFIVYRSAHSSLKAVNILIISGILLFILYSLLFEFTPLPIIILAVISLVQKAVYFREASKMGG